MSEAESGVKVGWWVLRVCAIVRRLYDFERRPKGCAARIEQRATAVCARVCVCIDLTRGFRCRLRWSTGAREKVEYV